MNLNKITQNYLTTVSGPGINLAFFDERKWEVCLSGTVDGITPTSPKIWYDIASVTKTFTATLLLDTLRTKRSLNLETSASYFLPFLQKCGDLTLCDLLMHRSGLQIIQRYDKLIEYSAVEIETLLFSAENIKIVDEGKPQYSDLNYLFLGRIVECILDTDLKTAMADFCTRFKVAETGFLPLQNGISADEIAPSDNHVPRGKPQDEKARWLGGVAGHAGMFATLQGLQNWAQAWLENRFEFDTQTYTQSCPSTDWRLSDPSYFGLVWRSGLLSPLPNHAGFAGPSIILNPYKNTACVQTSNHNFPQRNQEKRSNWIAWHHAWANFI